ncbi:MAG TPA: type IVB secretion system protein IcmH/DotU, partial [Vicinamibacterales bacterium]
MANSDDPFVRPDATRMRPRPGAGRRTFVDAPRPAPAGVIADAPSLERAWLSVGLNPLVQAAGPLLLITAHVRETLSMDVTGLRRQALDEIRRFEEEARTAGVPSEVVLSARYILCASLDEAVLSTPWGNQSEWAQHPLLVALHREAWGGEKFFDMLDRISPDPARYIDLMELQYLCIAFGFTGKYQIQERGQEHLQNVQHDLFR